MTLQTINIGTVPDDRTGDPLRTAFDKINSNFLSFGTIVVQDADNVVITGGTLSGITSLTMAGDIDLNNTGGVDNVNFVQYDLGFSGPVNVGCLSWNNVDGTLEVGALGGTVVLQIGQESHVRGVNKSGVTINDGEAVTIIGAQGNRPKFDLSDADNAPLRDSVTGLATEDITNNGEGYITTFGFVRGLNTSSFSEGDRIWATDTPGQISNVPPTPPSRKVFIGTVVASHTTQGSIFVGPVNVPNLSALSDILITGIADQDIIWWDAANSRWKNESLSNSLDLRYVEVAGDTMTGQLKVDLGSDTEGIVVQGDAGQTVSLQEWQSSAGTPLVAIGNAGTLETNKDRVVSTEIITTTSAMVDTVEEAICNSATPITVTLPTHKTDKRIRIINKGAGTVTLSPTSGTIKGSPTESLLRWESLILLSDNTDWI